MLSRGGSDCCGLRGDGGGRGTELVIGSGENTSNEPDTGSTFTDTSGQEKRIRTNKNIRFEWKTV